MRARLAWILLGYLCVGLSGGALAVSPESSRGRSFSESSFEDEETQRMFRQSVALGIPEGELAELMRGCRDIGFTSAELRRVLGLMVRAKLAGLPHDDLLNKLREGLAKRARPDAIEKAVEAKAQSLRVAKSLVDGLLTEGRAAPNYALAVKVVADALETGASAADILQAVREGRSLGERAPDVQRMFRDAK